MYNPGPQYNASQWAELQSSTTASPLQRSTTGDAFYSTSRSSLSPPPSVSMRRNESAPSSTLDAQRSVRVGVIDARASAASSRLSQLPPYFSSSLDDIPVLEASPHGDFDSDYGADDDEDDEEGDFVVYDDDEIDKFASERQRKNTYRAFESVGYDADEQYGPLHLDDGEVVPVLQTVEDAKRMEAMLGGSSDRRLSKRFTWRELKKKSPHRLLSAPFMSSATSERDSATASPWMRHTTHAGVHRDLREDAESARGRTSSHPVELTHGRSSPSQGPLNGAHMDRQLVRSGWLLKQSAVLRAWKRRFFVLIKRTNTLTGEFTASLQYYKGSKFGRLRGEVHLQDGPLVVRFLDVNEMKKPHCFEIRRNELSMICQGMDEEDVSAWVCHLQSLADVKSDVSTPSTANSSHVGSSVSAAPNAMKRGRTATAMDDRNICMVAELRRLLHNVKSEEAVQCREFVKNLEFNSESVNPLREFRIFHASLTESIMKQHAKRILETLEGKKSSCEGLEELEEIGMNEIRLNVSRHVEEVLFTPLQESISLYLSKICGEEELSMNRKLRWLQGKDQTYFNIPLHHVSWKEWRQASKTLSKMAACSLPTAKHSLIASTIKQIQSTYAEEHSKVFDGEALDTDDIIPIFTFVLANSGLDNLISLKLLLTELNGAWAVGGISDEGVAMSIFSNAVEFISEVTIPAALEDIFKDQITLSIDGDWRRILEFEVEPTYQYGAIIHQISPHGYTAVGSTISRGHVLVTVNGQNVVLWPFADIATLLRESSSPHRFAFIPGNSYFKILTGNKSLWNVALVHACQRGDLGSVQMLLANGADVNYVAQECGGNTPLHVAASALHFNVVSYLLQHGARAKMVGELGRTALHMVGAPCTMPSPTSTSITAIVGSVIKQQSYTKHRPEDRVMLIVRKLLFHGARIDSVDMYGNTPLMLLAERGCVNGIDALVEASATVDLDHRNWHQGMSALALAAKEGHREVAEALLDYGAIVDIRTLRGETPLHFAAGIACKPICKLLIEKGSDVEARSVDGLTPLMIAAGCGRDIAQRAEPTCDRLRASQVSSTSIDRNTHVDSSSVADTINYLLANGADKESVCRLYRLPLHYAGLGGGYEHYHILLNQMNKDVDGQMRDIYGKEAVALLEQCEGDGNRESPTNPYAGFDIITEEKEGGWEIVAGTFENVANVLFRCEDYHLEEVEALIRFCDYTDTYKQIIDFLRSLLGRYVGTLKGFFVRRMVLHALDKIVENMKHRVQCDLDVCHYISDFCDELFPFSIDEDPQCAQWLSSSLLPLFVEACRSERMQEFQILTSCEQDYTSLKHFLGLAREKNPSLKFLDDELFVAAPGLEIISDSMRRRLSIAGVSFCEPRKQAGSKSEPSRLTERSTLSEKGYRGSQPRMSILDRFVARLWIVDLDANAIAQQMTLLQHYLFSKIKVSEILATKRCAKKTPAFDRLKQLHNHTSVWVVSQILSRDEVDQRAQFLAYFIKVASVCLHPLQNFDGFMAVMNATNDSSIFRLKKTWGRLAPQAKDLWHELKKMTENGARHLNKLTKEAVPPCIPYMGVVIQNVLALQEYPDTVEGDLINFKKIRFIGNLIQKLLECQRTPYLLPTDDRVLDHLFSSMQFPDNDACFARSLKVEPRVAATKSR